MADTRRDLNRPRRGDDFGPGPAVRRIDEWRRPFRTNKAVDGWSDRAAVRLTGFQPLVLCEGARRMGQGAAETEARILVTLLETNSGNGPTLSDTKALFHVDHGNKAASGAVISDATLSAARLALRTQKGIDGRIIRVTPKNLLVPDYAFLSNKLCPFKDI